MLSDSFTEVGGALWKVGVSESFWLADILNMRSVHCTLFRDLSVRNIQIDW